jgi:hypothetical protein
LHQRSSPIGQANNELFTLKGLSDKSSWVIKGWLVTMKSFLHDSGMAWIFTDGRKMDDSFRGDKSEDAQSLLLSSYLTPALPPPPPPFPSYQRTFLTSFLVFFLALLA